MTITIDPSILLNYYNSREGILTNSSSSTTSGSTTSSASTSTSSTTSNTTAAPTPPWDASNASTQASALATKVLNGANVIPSNPAQLSVKGASTDYQSLFTAYQGLTALSGLVADALATGPTATNTAQAAKALAAGLTQVSTYVNGLSLQHVQLTTGTVQSTDASTAGPAVNNSTYTTGVIFSGGLTDPVPAFSGNVQFNINITNYSGKQTTIPIDLSQMGSTPRTMPNVVNYLNSQLSAAGAVTRFATDGTPAAPETVTVNGKKVTLPAGLEQWALQINGDSTETVSFSAPATAPAVYVAQTSGDAAGYAAQTVAATAAQDEAAITGVPAPATNSSTQVAAPIQQIVKLQTNASTTPTAPSAAQVIPGTPGASPDEAFAQTLDPNVASVAATATGSDGSVYVLANVTGAVDGQTPQSSQNIALQKYDSAGNLIYSTILGSSGEASGLSLAVSADGQVAVAGSVTGALNPSSTGNGANTQDSFVAVYNSQGEQQWSTTGLSPSNNQVNAVTFGANDTVYVAGQNNVVSTTNSASYGPVSGYVAGYSSRGDQLFNVSTGTANASGVAVDGNTLVVAGATSSGNAQVNSYTLPAKGAPTLTASRNLGSLGAGSIAGVAINNGQVVVAGTTSNGALSAGAVTSAFSGRQDAFVAQLSENLAPSASDAVAYYGGTGNTKATALTVSGGQVYIAGTSTGGLPGLTNQGTQEGFVANINVSTGAVGWSQALDGQAGVDAPESIAVASGGASVLDRLGLPTQPLSPNGSQLLTATTPVSAGDQFKIATSVGGTTATITIAADDTPQTLAQKIVAASGFQVTATVLPLNGVDQVQIKPQNSSQVIELLPGPAGLDALGPLGLSPGIIQTAPAVPATPKANPDRGAPKTTTTTAPSKDSYGLNIAQDFDLSTTAGLKAAQTAIHKAMTTLQTAYTNLVNVTNPAPASQQITGTVPAYISAELANYQAGLSRLTGGSSSTSSTGTSSASIASSILA